MHFFRVLLFSILALAILCPSVMASLEWSVEPAIPLDEEAVDSAQAPDGSRLFVLTSSGKVLVLNPTGKLETTIDGSFKAESLSVSNDGKRLFLVGKGQKKVQVVSLLDRFDIPVGNSPVKGDIAAAVAVVVFSDFQ